MTIIHAPTLVLIVIDNLPGGGEEEGVLGLIQFAGYVPLHYAPL